MKEHTPTPWFDDGYRIYGYTDHEDKRRGKVIVEHKHVDDFNPADAELIITAVNMHAELAAALENLRDHCNDGAWAGAAMRAAVVADLVVADALLAKVKGPVQS